LEAGEKKTLFLHTGRETRVKEKGGSMGCFGCFSGTGEGGKRKRIRKRGKSPCSLGKEEKGEKAVLLFLPREKGKKAGGKKDCNLSPPVKGGEGRRLPGKKLFLCALKKKGGKGGAKDKRRFFRPVSRRKKKKRPRWPGRGKEGGGRLFTNAVERKQKKKKKKRKELTSQEKGGRERGNVSHAWHLNLWNGGGKGGREKKGGPYASRLGGERGRKNAGGSHALHIVGREGEKGGTCKGDRGEGRERG